MTYANDNYQWVENDDYYDMSIIEAAELLLNADWDDDYKGFYNDGWIITETETHYQFDSENGALSASVHKGQVDLVIDNL